MAKKILITDVTLRDAHQSLIATRMTTEEMLPILEKMDKVGFYSLECWGGATFDACLRFLNEDPWERLRKIMEYNSSIGRFQFIRSHESVFIQLADVLMGAINYNLRYEKGEVEGRVRAKMKLIEKIKKHSNISLNTTTPKFRKKFNLFFIALK